jgi:hypothetical protein
MRKTKKNPPVRPEKPFLLYDHIAQVRGEKENGRYAGRYYHNFSKKHKVHAYGLPDGSVILKSSDGKSLWKKSKQ